MTRKLLIVAMATFLSANVFAATEAELIKAAKSGDYQAQRNLGYSYAIGWMNPGDPEYIAQNFVKACGWYRIVMMSKNDKVNIGDSGNERIYCSKLDLMENKLAWDFARAQSLRK